MSERPRRTVRRSGWRQLDEADDIQAALDAVLDEFEQQHSRQRRSDSDGGVQPASNKRFRASGSAQAAGNGRTRSRTVEPPAAAETPEEVLEGMYGEEEAMADDIYDEEDQLREDRPWDQEERQDHAERHRKRTKTSTAKQYKPQINAFKEWCDQSNCSDRVVDLSDVPKLARFFDKYCSGSWLPRTGGRNRKQQGLGNDAAMNLHAALVHHVKCCCIEDGVEEVDPKQDPGYLVYYRQYAGNRGFTRKHDVQGQFSKEDHLTIARAAYAIGDSYKMLLISLAIVVVSRGDEIRDLLLKHMRLKKSDAIGPASCWTLQYALGDRKINNGKPEQKVFIRNRVPEACAMGWMGQHFHKRFKLDKERLPPPGSAELDSVFLFPGRNAGIPISYTQHKAYIDNALVTQEIHTDKSTHVMRVYAAELMNAMGVELDSIRYAGGWKQDSLGTSYIVFGSNPQALLALGMWRSDRVDFNCYWQPRMRIGVPVELIWHALPQLEGFMQQVQEAVAAVAAGDKTQTDAARHKHLARVVFAVVTIAIQDAIELADAYPHNTFIADMNRHPLFRRYVRYYKAYKDMGGFEKERPIPLREHLNKLDSMLTQLVHGQSSNRLTSSSSGGNCASDGDRSHPFQADIPGSYGADWDHNDAQEGDDDLQEAAAEHQQQERRPHQQQAASAGRADGWFSTGDQHQQQEQQQQGQQQQEDVQQQQQQQQHRSNTGSGGAQGGASDAERHQQQSDPAASSDDGPFSTNGRRLRQPRHQRQPPVSRDSGSNGSQDAGAAEQQQQQQQPCHQQQQREDVLQSPVGIFGTPGGHERSMAGCGDLFTPEGEHYGNFWIPEQHTPFSQQLVSPQQNYRSPPQQHQQSYGGQGVHHHHQQQQQQQPAAAGQGSHQSQGQQYQQQCFRQQEHFQQQQQQGEAAAGAGCSEFVRLMEKQIALLQTHLEGMPPGPEAFEVMKQITSLLEEVRPHRAASMQRQQQQWQPQPMQSRWGNAAKAGSVPGMMGQDPIEDMMEPGISNNPAFRAAVGSRLGGFGRPDPTAAILEYVDFSLKESITAAMQQCGLGAGSAAASAAAGNGPGAAPTAANATRPPSERVNSSAAAPQEREVPYLKDQKSLSDLLAWYTQVRDIPLKLADGRTVMKTRSEMRDLNHSWTSRKYSQRAAEYDVIYDRLKAHAVELTIKAGQPKTVEDAVVHVVATESVGSKGGPTISKYQKACTAWRKAQKAAAAAAAAMATAAADDVPEEEASQQEESEGGV